MKLKTFIAIGACSAIVVAGTASLVFAAKLSTSGSRGTIVSDYENVMNMTGVPVSDQDASKVAHIAPFSDLGSWHSHSLPSYTARNYWGGFTQPMIVAQSSSIATLGKSLDQLQLLEYVLDKDGNIQQNDNGTYKLKEVPFKALPEEKVHIKQYPGGLWQEFELNDLTLQVNLRFTHQKVSMVRYNIIDKEGEKRKFKMTWSGQLWDTESFKDSWAPVIEQKGYIDNSPYKVNVFGQPLMKKAGSAAETLVYVWYDQNNKLVPFTDQAAINSSNHAHTFQSNGKKVYLVTPQNLRAWRNQDSTLLSDYNFINKYQTGDQANLDNPENIINNTVSIGLTSRRNDSNKWGNWLGHRNNWKYQITFPQSRKIEINHSDLAYSATTAHESPIEVGAYGNADLYVSTSFAFTAQERTGFKYHSNLDTEGRDVPGIGAQIKKDSASNENAKTAFDDTAKRWNYYLDNLVGSDDQPGTYEYRKVAVKAMETLVNNWRGNAGMLVHEGITPSMSIYYFNSFWSWDSWKQASAAVHFDPKLAMDNVKVLFDNQVIDDQSRDMLYHFDANRRKSDLGMIPDLVDYNQPNTNWRDTKPPLSAWAVYNIYETVKAKMWNKTDIRTGKKLQDEVKEFLKYMYVRLMAYHSWWYLNRDADGNGINEYGATLDDGEVADWQGNHDEYNVAESTAWESGMDNAIRFDTNGSGPDDPGLKWTLNRNNDGSVAAFVLQQESVDLNSYMYAEKQYLTKIAQALQTMQVPYNTIEGIDQNTMLYQKLMKPLQSQLQTRLKGVAKTQKIMGNIGNSYEADIKQFADDSVLLKKYINEKMFDSNSGFFYDLRFDVDDTGKRVVEKDHLLVNRGKGPEGFIPLWAEAATSDNAKQVRKIIMSPQGFNTYMPFPTAAYDNPKFEPDQYWRGPVWLDQAYFGVRALDRYGYDNDASYMVAKLFNNAEGLLQGAPIRENYNPLTGEGLNARGFSWSSGMYLLMYEQYIKGGR